MSDPKAVHVYDPQKQRFIYNHLLDDGSTILRFEGRTGGHVNRQLVSRMGWEVRDGWIDSVAWEIQQLQEQITKAVQWRRSAEERKDEPSFYSAEYEIERLTKRLIKLDPEALPYP